MVKPEFRLFSDKANFRKSAFFCINQMCLTAKVQDHMTVNASPVVFCVLLPDMGATGPSDQEFLESCAQPS